MVFAGFMSSSMVEDASDIGSFTSYVLRSRNLSKYNRNQQLNLKLLSGQVAVIESWINWGSPWQGIFYRRMN
jgi:hypothetical protein